MLNLAFLLEQSTASYPDKTAVILDDYRLSYRETNGAANKLANVLVSLGVQPGSKVAMMLPNIPSFAVCYYGILKTGATVVPLNVMFKHNEVKYHLEDSDSVVLIVWEDFLHEAMQGVQQTETCKHILVVQAPDSTNPLPEGTQSLHQALAIQPPLFESIATMPDDTAVILYTSGTTGRPKGAELTHFNMFSNAQVCAERIALLTPDDIGLATLPLFHAFGLTALMNACIYASCTVSMLPRFEPRKALEVMQRDQVTFFCGVPTMYSFLLRYPHADRYDLALRCCISGGASMPVEVMQAFNRKYNLTILEGYGLSETSPVVSFNHQHRPPKPGSIGTAIWGVEVRVVNEADEVLPTGEVGELLVRGHNVMKGYYKSPEITAEVLRGTWFHTGDLARMDEDGYIYIVDRVKDVIIRAGMNIYPREVEEVLYGHPAVAEAAVIGVSHDVQGERVKAFIVLKQDYTPVPEEQEIIHYCKERLADYKVPRMVKFCEVLPKTMTGKILKRELE
jgi:long-chain acyl-CoA synthetase